MEVCECHLEGGVHAVLEKFITKQFPRDFLREETWFLCALILPSPRRCPICYEILDHLGIVRLEGGGYKMSTNWLFWRQPGTGDI